MTDASKFSRRTILTAGSTALTPANPEGPFYPKHQQGDKGTDLTLRREPGCDPLVSATWPTSLRMLPLRAGRKAGGWNRLNNKAQSEIG